MGFYSIEVILILKIVYKYGFMFWPNLFDSTANISPGEGYVLDSSPSQQNGMEMCCLVFWFKLKVYYRYAFFSFHKTTLLLVTQIKEFLLKHTQIFKFNWIRGISHECFALTGKTASVVWKLFSNGHLRCPLAL